ncbi:hypothetical protein CF326_g10114, partial [Tilletia indica]
KEAQAVTKLDRDVSSGTASQEINFWLTLERESESIERQLRAEPINLTLEVLKHAKRFHATVTFYSNTGMKEWMGKIQSYNALMKDFPLNELLSATDLEKIQQALVDIFTHISRKLRNSPYPTKRVLLLIEAISRDLNDILNKILGSQRLMYQEFPRFCDTLAAASDIFATWDASLKEFVTLARELIKKRNEKFLPIKVQGAHEKLRERLNYIGAFRKTHEQFRVMVTSGKATMLMGPSAGNGVAKQPQVQTLAGIEMDEEIRAAYETVKVIDVLDVSQEGTEIWAAAETAYNERVSRVENSLIAKLRDMLGQAKSA